MKKKNTSNHSSTVYQYIHHHVKEDMTMNPETRILRQVTVENAAEADRIFSMLMGDEVPPRREFIEQNAHYANIDA